MVKKTQVLLILALLCGCGGEKRKNDRDRFFLLGNEALKKREYKEAVRLYSEAIKLDDNYADAYNNRGLAQLKRGDAASALLDFNQALLIRKDDIAFKWNRAEAYAAVNRPEKALADIDDVRKAYPDSAAVYFAEGLIHFQFQNLPEAEAAFSEAIRLDSTNGEAFINRGTVRYYRGKLEEAERDLREGLETRPEEANAWNTLALLEAERGKLQQAFAHIEKALSVSPNDAYFLNNKGYILLAADSLEAAARLIDTSIMMDPQNAWAYRNKGIFHFKSGQFAEALRLFSRARELDKKVEGIHLWMAKTHLALGNTGSACEALAQSGETEEALELKKQHCPH